MSTSTTSGESGIFTNSSDENYEDEVMNMDDDYHVIQPAVTGQLNLLEPNVSKSTPSILDHEKYLKPSTRNLQI